MRPTGEVQLGKKFDSKRHVAYLRKQFRRAELRIHKNPEMIKIGEAVLKIYIEMECRDEIVRILIALGSINIAAAGFQHRRAPFRSERGCVSETSRSDVK
jgi:hypothetical protein